MKSSGFQVRPKSSDNCRYETGEKKTRTQRKSPCKGRGSDCSYAGTAKECLELPTAGRAKES